MALVELEAVSKSYLRYTGLAAKTSTVVDDVSFEIVAGETLGLVGESGSGKSTVARMILGLTPLSRGRIRVQNIDIGQASRKEMKLVRRQTQPVFQDPYGALNPRMNVFKIITEPFAIHGLEALSASGPGTSRKTELRRRAGELLREVGLDDSALSRYPHEFSGGQRQRINIARALALRPKLLILDEPVSALDVSVGAQVINLLRTLQRDHGLTYLFISHSMPLVRYLSTRIAVMERGRLIEIGESESVCTNPREEYTRKLLAATPELPVAGTTGVA